MKEKQSAVHQINALVSSGHSHCSACLSVGIPHIYQWHWKTVINRVIGIQENNEFLSYNMTCTCRKVHNGCKSILSAIEPKLKAYILDLCQKDIQLTIQMVQREASRLFLHSRRSHSNQRNWWSHVLQDLLDLFSILQHI